MTTLLADFKVAAWQETSSNKAVQHRELAAYTKYKDGEIQEKKSTDGSKIDWDQEENMWSNTPLVENTAQDKQKDSKWKKKGRMSDLDPDKLNRNHH